MASLILWWLVLWMVGLVAFPLAYILLSRFPDRGYIFSKVLALLLVGYLSWVLGYLKFGTQTVLISFFFLALVSGALLWTWIKKPFMEFVSGNVALFLLLECVFFLAFLVAGAYKMRTFGIVGQEKPMDFTFINGILASTSMPPQDPWLAGGSISYYYFGYFIVACLAKVTGVTGGEAYNLGVALLWALAFTCAFSLAYALTRRYRYSLFSAFSLAILGNLDYWHRAVQSFQVGNLRIPYYNEAPDPMAVQNAEVALRIFTPKVFFSSEFWSAFKVFFSYEAGKLGDSVGFLLSPLRYGWDYFQASRISPVPPNDKMINEFPSFSFFLSDLHPHLMAIPFVLLAMALAYNVLKSPLPGWRLFGGSAPWRVFQGILMGLALGGLSFLNSWDFPTFTFLFGLCLLFQQLWAGEEDFEEKIKSILLVGTPILLVAFLSYLPFYLRLQTQAHGIGVVTGGRTELYHFVVIFGLFLAVLVPALVGKVFGAPRQRTAKGRKTEEKVCMVCGQGTTGKNFCGSCGGELVPSPDAEIPPIPSVEGREGLTETVAWLLGNPLGGWGLLGGAILFLAAFELVPANLAVLLAAFLLLFLTFLSLGSKAESKEMVFATFLVAVAFLLVAGCEVFYMKDLFSGALYRMNTVFKFHYQVWLLLAIASGPFLKWTFEVQWPSWGPGKRLAWGAVAGFALLGASLYPVLAFTSRIRGSNDPVTMDGAVYYEKAFNADYQAAQWIRSNVKPAGRKAPIVLEAWGDSYMTTLATSGGRLATLTGYPTILGWAWHEVQWRGSGDKKVIRGGREDDTIQRRQTDIDSIYTTQDPAQARELLTKYGVQYLYVGGVEREKYKDHLEGFGKFGQLGPMVWQLGDSSLYKVAP